MSVTLHELLKEDGAPLSRVPTATGELAGPCPRCGGDDRFRVWPGEGTGGRFFCRRCNWTGDAVGYLRDQRGVSFPDAYRAVTGQEPPPRKGGPAPAPARYSAGHPAQKSPRPSRVPPEAWRKKARALVGYCHDQLFTPAGKPGLDLLAGRGISEPTARRFRLGWSLKKVFRPRAGWGLEEADDRGRPRKMLIPGPALVIPRMVGDEVHGVKFRNQYAGAENRYQGLAGSGSGCMVINPGPIMTVVESELCAILLAQDTGSITGVMALGSAGNRPGSDTAAMLDRAKLILIALDNDAAGAKSTWDWWLQKYPRARACPVPAKFGGKDPTEARQNGMNLRVWILAAREHYGHPAFKPEPEPLRGVRGAAGDWYPSTWPPRGTSLLPGPTVWRNLVTGRACLHGSAHYQERILPLAEGRSVTTGHKGGGQVRCRECKSFIPGSGTSMAMGFCEDDDRESQRGQWPMAPHLCASFTPAGATQHAIGG